MVYHLESLLIHSRQLVNDFVDFQENYYDVEVEDEQTDEEVEDEQNNEEA